MIVNCTGTAAIVDKASGQQFEIKAADLDWQSVGGGLEGHNLATGAFGLTPFLTALTASNCISPRVQVAHICRDLHRAFAIVTSLRATAMMMTL